MCGGGGGGGEREGGVSLTVRACLSNQCFSKDSVSVRTIIVYAYVGCV